MDRGNRKRRNRNQSKRERERGRKRGRQASTCLLIGAPKPGRRTFTFSCCLYPFGLLPYWICFPNECVPPTRTTTSTHTHTACMIKSNNSGLPSTISSYCYSTRLLDRKTSLHSHEFIERRLCNDRGGYRLIFLPSYNYPHAFYY